MPQGSTWNKYGLTKEKDRKGIMMPVSHVAHRNIKKIKMNHSWIRTFWHCSKSRRFASAPRTKDDTLCLCWSQSTVSHTGSIIYGEHWRSPFWVSSILMCIQGWFSQIWFWIKRGNLWSIIIILRTGKSSIILGFPKILELLSINHLHRDTTNSLLLYLSWIILWPSGWSHNKTKFPSGISIDIWFDISALFYMLCWLP